MVIYLLSIEDDLDLGRNVSNVGSSICNKIKQVEMCFCLVLGTWFLSLLRFNIWSRLGLVATEPDLVLSSTNKTGKLTNIQARVLTPSQWPNQWLTLALISSIFPFAFFEGKVGSRNVISLYHLKRKKNCERSNDFCFHFPWLWSKWEERSLCNRKVGWLAGWFVISRL